MANEQLAEQAADHIEEVAVQVEKVADATRRITGKDVGLFSTGIVVGLGIGFAVGYYVADHRLKTKYSKLAAGEISRIREHYYAKDKAREPKPPLSEIRVEEKVIVEERPTKPSVPVQQPQRSRNVFQPEIPDDEAWDYEEELKKRSKDAPYIIHVDEFRENTPEHDQVTYTYYEMDDVFANVRDEPLEEDYDKTIGLENIQHWGHGSEDPNIVFVRNERLTLDFEIIRDRGSYHDQVSGTIRHSANRENIRPRRKFDDE